MSGRNSDISKSSEAGKLGLYEPPQTRNVTGIEITAIVLSLLWLGAAVIFMLRAPEGTEFQGLEFLLTMLVIFLPIAMIWVAATAARSARIIREESHRLQAAIDAIRHTYVTQQQNAAVSQEPSVARKLDEIAERTKKTESALATFQSSRSENQRPVVERVEEPAPVDEQPVLALGTSAEELAPPLLSDDFIRALNFPETAEDEAGFAALRRALKDRKAADLIQAAQDVLTLLSQDGIYMDDLRPDMARPEVWRQFAQGSRGRAVAALGGVRDRTSLALTNSRMKQDPIFRDTAHHFLRKFDRMMIEFETTASDADLTALGETRTARAFMLLGRVAGTFD